MCCKYHLYVRTHSMLQCMYYKDENNEQMGKSTSNGNNLKNKKYRKSI